MYTETVTDGTAGQVRAKLKWFNLQKGFGFVVPENENIDAFIHITVLQKAGIDGLGEGARLLCSIERSAKGASVKDVISVLDVGLHPKPFIALNRNASNKPVVELTGIVKWYKPEDGFGFVTGDDGGKDIFLHQKLLRRYGLVSIEPRTSLLMKVRATTKGREAVEFTILDD